MADAVTAATDLVKQRDTEENTPEVQAAAAKAQEQAAFDRIQKDVAEGNIDEIRKDIAASPNTGPAT